jgi:glycosyltransferase involved in cell wall biosynthesis
MAQRKGGRFVVELAERCRNRKFIMIGVRDLHQAFPDNVLPLGQITDQAELAAYYSAADITLLVSEMENLPTVGLESICCGTPVAGFDRGGAAETAPPGCGKFVPFGDMEALEKAVLESLAAGPKPAKFCAAYGSEHYSSAVMARRYLDVYKEYAGRV